MKIRFLHLSIGSLVLAMAFFLLPADGQDEVAGDGPPNMMKRYAEAYLKLAEVQLERRLEANEASPGLFSKRQLDRGRLNIEIAREQLRLASVPAGDAVELHVKRAQEAATVAEADYQKALKAVKITPRAYTPLQVEEFRLKSEVAHLRLAVWGNPNVSVFSMMDHVHWQLERLSEEVIELQSRVDKLEMK